MLIPSVARAGDADGDGTGDLLVGAYRETVDGKDGAGRAYVFGGADGSLLRTLESPNGEVGGRFGWSLAQVGDADGDGTGDLLVGAYRETVDGISRAGRAYVLSGADGSLLQALTSPNAEEDGQFGKSVAPAGDANGDGTGDFLIGAPEETADGKDEAGRAYVFSPHLSRQNWHRASLLVIKYCETHTYNKPID